MKTRLLLLLVLSVFCTGVHAQKGPASVPSLIHLPDLVVAEILQEPQNPMERQHWRFKVTIRNQGTGFARIPRDYHYMAVLGRNGWVGVTYNSAVTLAPGETFTGSQYHPETPGPGTHVVTFRVDPGAIVQESNDSNNERTFITRSVSPSCATYRCFWWFSDGAGQCDQGVARVRGLIWPCSADLASCEGVSGRL